MEEDLKHKLDESNVLQIEETTIKVKERIRTIEKTIKSIENDQETKHKAVVSHKERRGTQEISQTKEDLKHKLDESNVAQIEETTIKVKERIRTIEEIIKSIVNDQETIHKAVVSHKERTARQEKPQTKAEISRKSFEQTKAMLAKEKEDLTKLLEAKERKEKELKELLLKSENARETLEKAKAMLEKEKEDLTKQLAAGERNGQKLKELISKKTSHALSGSEKMAQRKNQDSYLCDETQSVFTESTDSGRGSMHSGLEYQDSFILNRRQLKTELKVAVTVTNEGANMHISDTGVELDIPGGAVRGKVLIDMIILPFDKLDATVSTFSCNSSVAVELLPNRMEFQRPVRLILPHCLKLTKNYKKTKNQVQVYVSHYETGPPIWEEVSNAKYVLDETNCAIFLKSFCWVKYEVNDKIVEAKRIRVYTAGKRLKHTEDTLAETEVGYHWDLPTARENLSINDNMFVYQSKPFIFVKQGNLPLEILLTKTVPRQWKFITPEENPKVISFKCVADSKEKTCPFVIEKSEPTDGMPFCMFKVQQGNEDMEIYIRFDD